VDEEDGDKRAKEKNKEVDEEDGDKRARVRRIKLTGSVTRFSRSPSQNNNKKQN
jgi:hypothetical protein